MSENLKMETYIENEKKFCQIEKDMNEIGKIIKQIESEKQYE